MSDSTAVESAKPVYVPWKSFVGYLAGLKGATIPHMLDNTVKPSSMAGGLWRQILSGLTFLKLIDSDREVQPQLESLVNAYSTDQWPAAVKEHITSAYDGIIGDLPIENATQGQLDSCFREGGNVEGQMLQKAVRFYVHAMSEAGVTYSSHFAMRQERSTPRKKSAARKKKPATASKPEIEPPARDTPSAAPAGMIDFPLPTGEIHGFIRVRSDLTMDQYPMVEAMLTAVKVLAEQNSAAEATRTES